MVCVPEAHYVDSAESTQNQFSVDSADFLTFQGKGAIRTELSEELKGPFPY